MAPFENAICKAAALGYSSIELIVASQEDLEQYYTPQHVNSLRAIIERQGLTVSQFVINNCLLGGLSSYSSAEKRVALQRFSAACKIASGLTSPLVGTVSNWPMELKAPVQYIPSYIYPACAASETYDPKLTIDLRDDFEWNAAWDNYIDSIVRCARIAEEYGLKLAIENHPHCFISSTESYLRMFDQIDAPNLGANLDTGFALRQREYVPLSILKLSDRLFHVHLRDGDGLFSYNQIPGSGIINWNEVRRALKMIGYDGVLSVELSNYATPEVYFKKALQYLNDIF